MHQLLDGWLRGLVKAKKLSSTIRPIMPYMPVVYGRTTGRLFFAELLEPLTCQLGGFRNLLRSHRTFDNLEKILCIIIAECASDIQPRMRFHCVFRHPFAQGVEKSKCSNPEKSYAG